MCTAPTMAVFWSMIRWASSRAAIPRHSREKPCPARRSRHSRNSRTSASQSSRSSPREVRGDALGSPGGWGSSASPVSSRSVAMMSRIECARMADPVQSVQQGHQAAFAVASLARLRTCGPGELEVPDISPRVDRPHRHSDTHPDSVAAPDRDGSRSRGQCALLRSAQAARSPRPPSLDSSR
jgi:hypothetical protein